MRFQKANLRPKYLVESEWLKKYSIATIISWRVLKRLQLMHEASKNQQNPMLIDCTLFACIRQLNATKPVLIKYAHIQMVLHVQHLWISNRFHNSLGLNPKIRANFIITFVEYVLDFSTLMLYANLHYITSCRLCNLLHTKLCDRIKAIFFLSKLCFILIECTDIGSFEEAILIWQTRRCKLVNVCLNIKNPHHITISLATFVRCDYSIVSKPSGCLKLNERILLYRWNSNGLR